MRVNCQLETVRKILFELKEDHRKIIYETINMLNSRLIAAEMDIGSAMMKKSDCGAKLT